MSRIRKEGLHFSQNEGLLANAGLELMLPAELRTALDVYIPHTAAGIIIGEIEGDIHSPVSLRGVYVPQEQMPLRQLANMAMLFATASALIDQGVTAADITLVCPVYLNELVNATDAQAQMQQAAPAMKLFGELKSHFPSLSQVPLEYDFGRPINLSDEELIQRGRLIQETASPEIAALLEAMAANHAQEGVQGNMQKVAAYLYLGDHGPAWNLTLPGGISYPGVESDQLTVAFAPQSEASFIAGVAELVDALDIDQEWQSPAIVLFSEDVYPPYYLHNSEKTCSHPDLLVLDLNAVDPELPPKHLVAQAVQALRGPGNSWRGNRDLYPLTNALNFLQSTL